MKDFRDYSLLCHNTFGIDAQCQRFVEFVSVKELQTLVRSLTTADQPLLVIGGGSNLLFTADYPGTVLHSAIRGVEIVDSDLTNHYIRCGSGETWDDIVAQCVSNGWYGAENLSLIPGEVGASAVQNIGAYGVEVKDLIVQVEAVEIATGRQVSFTNVECCYSYRKSRFKDDWKGQFIITYVTYCLSKTFHPRLDYGNIRAALAKHGISEPSATELRNTIIAIRQAKLPDPKIEGNAGSFFMNPIVSTQKYLDLIHTYPTIPHYTVDTEHEKIPAGWLIDQCGWKGHTLGKAGVHDKQALVLVNKGGATGADILHLCDTIRQDVLQKFGIEIKPEVNIL